MTDVIRYPVSTAGRGPYSDGALSVAFWTPPLAVAHHAVHLVPVNVAWEDSDTLLGVLSGIASEVVVLAGSFQDEVSLMRTRSRWPGTVRVVAAIAAGLGEFSVELDQAAEGVVGPSQWEHNATFPDVVGPGSD